MDRKFSLKGSGSYFFGILANVLEPWDTFIRPSGNNCGPSFCGVSPAVGTKCHLSANSRWSLWLADQMNRISKQEGKIENREIKAPWACCCSIRDFTPSPPLLCLCYLWQTHSRLVAVIVRMVWKWPTNCFILTAVCMSTHLQASSFPFWMTNTVKDTRWTHEKKKKRRTSWLDYSEDIMIRVLLTRYQYFTF